VDVSNLISIPAGDSATCDVCIVGSGPAGATIAHELSHTSLKIILVESGDTKIDPEVDLLSEIENIGVPRVLDQSMMRSRVLGGTSYLWSGRCANFDGIDYQRRSWVPNSGWPIDAELMTPFLDRSATHLGLGIGSDYTGDLFWSMAKRRRPEPKIDSRILLPFFWQFSRDNSNRHEAMRFGPRLLSEQPDNLRIVTNATVVHVNTNETASEVHSVEVAALDDSRRTIVARSIVLCAGGIENARLLLASNRVCAAGLGNNHDVVGRYLMDHPRGSVATFDPSKVKKLQSQFGFHSVRTARGTWLFCQGMRLSPAIQEREGLTNCAVWLSELVGPDDPWSAFRRIARRRADWGRDPLTILLHPAMVARGAYSTFVKGGGVPRRLRGLGLNCAVEQRPDPDSRVTLACRMDRHGMPLSRVNWRVNEQEMETARRSAELVVEGLHKLAIPPPVPNDWVTARLPFPTSFRDAAHHIGTTRMSVSPRMGVVDADCQVHGVRGLFIAGSSVFPTGGHANPTQMIVALAIRLADTIKQRARTPQPVAIIASPPV
jgi:choline dehydrogenase-like flavoprotein